MILRCFQNSLLVSEVECDAVRVDEDNIWVVDRPIWPKIELVAHRSTNKWMRPNSGLYFDRFEVVS